MNPELFNALKNGDIKILEELLIKGVDIKQTDKYCNTALLLAAFNGQIAMVEYLLKNELSQISEKNKFGNTALLLAALNGRISMVEYLLKNMHSQISEKDNDGDTVLLVAAAYGQIPMVEYLLKNKISQISEKNLDGNTALLVATRTGDIAMVEYLLKNKYSKISEKDNNGNTALLVAARYGQVAMVDYLLKNKISQISEKDNEWNTALLLATRYGHASIVEYLIKNWHSHIVIVEYFFKNTYSQIFEKNKYGYTALLVAARYGQIPMVEYLLKNKISQISDKDNNGNTALLIAAADGRIPMVEYLLKNKLSHISEKNNNGNTALLIAAKYGETLMVEYLLKNKLSQISEKNKYGQTALLLAAFGGHTSLVEYFLSKPEVSLLEKCTHNGDSVLSMAAWNGHLDTVSFLLKRGAYIDLPLNNKLTPCQLIRTHLNQITLPVLKAASTLLEISKNDSGISVASLLDTLGEALNARGYKDGNTALHFAIQKGNKRLVAALLDKGASLEISNHINETPFQLALNSKNPHIIAQIYIAKIRKLSLELEQAYPHQASLPKPSLELECKEINEVREARDIKSIQKYLEEYLQEAIKFSLHETTTEFSLSEKSAICFTLGEILSKPNSPCFQPTFAYELLSVVNKENLEQFQKANTIIFHLLIGKHIILQKNGILETDIIAILPESGLEEPDREEFRCLRLKAEIRHLMLSNSEDKSILGKLIAEYALGEKHSMEGIKGISGEDVGSQLVLIDKIREMNLENMKLKEQQNKANSEVEAAKKRERDFEKLELEKADLKRRLDQFEIFAARQEVSSSITVPPITLLRDSISSSSAYSVPSRSLVPFHVDRL